MIPRTWADRDDLTRADRDVLDAVASVGVDPHAVLPEIVGVVASLDVLVRQMRGRGYSRRAELVMEWELVRAIVRAFAVRDERASR